MKTRQKIRAAIILLSFFLFPATFYYLSPVLIVQAAREGLINGSFIMFGLLFVSSLVLGRTFCGWVCPAAGCQEPIFQANDHPINRGNFLKWIIWVPWVGLIVILAIRGGGYRKVDFFYKTFHGLSISDVYGLMVYLVVLLMLIVLPALALGKRSFCHHLCWMAPFMILGRKIRNAFGWPSLSLAAQQGNCTSCRKCTMNCPMSLPVMDMAEKGELENTECILCGSCIDGCDFDALRYKFFGQAGNGMKGERGKY